VCVAVQRSHGLRKCRIGWWVLGKSNDKQDGRIIETSKRRRGGQYGTLRRGGGGGGGEGGRSLRMMTRVEKKVLDLHVREGSTVGLGLLTAKARILGRVRGSQNQE